ncbi:MAG: 1-deoxy-D-xylulose-5-phosphate reductoisomerase, partial [Eggerthellaceae bacterium]|nr:1-deoxy-D-xylulose-5-phosphate reductoisomerase [Eggerthellaceae bacterium]
TGIAGLDAVWTALDVCDQVLLANKEALVTGGDLVTEKAARLKKPLLPVDSEHSAIFQCLQAAQGNPVRSIVLTASGGALRTWEKDRIMDARVSEVLNHPTWRMGKKITVDCASMVNKGLEVIEAKHLFGVSYDQIKVVVQRESLIHSMVEFTDGSVKAHLGSTDMRIPIQYALSYPDRWPAPVKALDFCELDSIHFEAPDFENFPCLKFALQAGETGGTLPCVMNAANEVAVSAFLKEQCSYLDIPRCIDACMQAHIPDVKEVKDLETIKQSDKWAREYAINYIDSLNF